MDYIKAVAQHDEETQIIINQFLDAIDPSHEDDAVRTIAYRALKGQAVQTQAFEAYEAGKRVKTH